MAILRKITISLVLSIILLYFSFNAPLIPCKKTYNLLGVRTEWGFCQLTLTGKTIGEDLYFGKYSVSFEAIIAVFGFFFLLFLFLLFFIFRKRKHN